jgi:minimal PKS chain-length factor (CLF/KS beta)
LRAYRPFATGAAGYLPGEGGAVFVVEDLAHARERGAPRIYGEVAGWAATHDAAHTSTPHADRVDAGPVDAGQYARAMRLALLDAGVAPAAVGVVFPDALGVARHDLAEATALRAVFGPRTPPVTTQKPLLGRAHQGGAALDVATALLALRHGLLPASAGPREPAPGCELNFVRRSAPPEGDVALVGARGFDGFNSALVLRTVDALPGATRRGAAREDSSDG